ncbi:response regulator [Nitrosopumilus sp. K4]|uniref:response regulator n=1 Tax=Nitrosopumilus sp. K4 TaxID=2795383 RepID=UPI001BA9CD5B|nr:response regulator [Nitrosopumilus sp. K4]QUC65558.1 response regulator [Nitrosopumilus sp. K4]
MSKGLILVADDDIAVLDTTCTFLEFFGYDVIQAHDGLDALTKYKKFKPGLVFLDVKMPKMDGYATFFELKKQFHDANVVLMTAHADYSEWEKAKKENVLELIEKPYSAEQLKKITEKFYGK